MKIISRWTSLPTDGRAVVTIGNRTIDVVLRVGNDVRCLDEAMSIPPIGIFHVAFITGPRKAIWQAGKPLAVAETGDVVILLCTSNKARQATLRLLGLEDPRNLS